MTINTHVKHSKQNAMLGESNRRNNSFRSAKVGESVQEDMLGATPPVSGKFSGSGKAGKICVKEGDTVAWALSLLLRRH